MNQIKNSYYNILIEKIPILKDKNLINMIVEYCIIVNNSKQLNKYSTILAYIEIINKYLIDNIKKNQKNEKNEKNSIIEYTNNKIIKKHKLTFKALIESIIHVIVYFEDPTLTVNVSINLSLKNDKLNELMNIAKGIPLQSLILSIYNSNDNDNDKNEKLLHLLQNIARKLEILQEKCGFIHGDFHSNNIFVSDDDITFIDFGYSSVRIPFSNDTYLILSTPLKANIDRKYPLDILNEVSLKAVDMYHLIDNLGTFTQKNNHENIYGQKIIYFQDKKNYTLFIDFIQVIKKYFFKTNFKNSMNRHFFTSSTYFEDKFKKDKIKKLYPENFIHLSLDILNNKNINNDENTKFYKKKTISGISFPMYNNNANLTATKKTRTLSSPISKSLFSNNE